MKNVAQSLPVISSFLQMRTLQRAEKFMSNSAAKYKIKW